MLTVHNQPRVLLELGYVHIFTLLSDLLTSIKLKSTGPKPAPTGGKDPEIAAEFA